MLTVLILVTLINTIIADFECESGSKLLNVNSDHKVDPRYEFGSKFLNVKSDPKADLKLLRDVIHKVEYDNSETLLPLYDRIFNIFLDKYEVLEGYIGLYYGHDFNRLESYRIEDPQVIFNKRMQGTLDCHYHSNEDCSRLDFDVFENLCYFQIKQDYRDGFIRHLFKLERRKYNK